MSINDQNKIEDFLKTRCYEEAVEKSFKLIEKSLEQIFQLNFTSLSNNDQAAILAKLNTEYKNKNFEKLFIGTKLEIFDEFNLFSKWKIKIPRNYQCKRLLELNNIRVDSAHQKREIRKGEAYYVYGMALNVLSFMEKLENDISTIEGKNISDESIDILENLPEREYIEFIGREPQLEEIKLKLIHPKVHVLSIDGIGGVGKTSLSLEIAHRLKNENLFNAIIWVSAKDNILTYSGISKIERELLNLEDLFDEILKLFHGDDFIQFGDFSAKQGKVLSILKENNCLLIIDNLETIDDEDLKNFLISIEFPIESKVLITSRKRLGQAEYIIFLNPFDQEETKKYINSQLRFRNYKKECSEELLNHIHKQTGGIPLAVKMIIPWIIENKINDNFLIALDNQTNIMDFCFAKIYSEFLDENAKKMWGIFAIAPHELSSTAIRFISEMSDEEFNEALSQLINYTLINNSEKGFTILPLTQEYGKRMVSTDFPKLTENIKKLYQKFIQQTKNADYEEKTLFAINKAEQARLLAVKGDDEEVKNHFRQALQYDPNCDYVLFLYANYCRIKQDFGQAETLISKAIRIDGKNVQYWTEYASILEDNSSFKRAEKILEEAVRITNDRTLVHKLGLIKSKLQKNRESIDIAFKNIIKTRDKKERYTNTLLIVNVLEGHWRISGNFYNRKQLNEAKSELKQGLNQYNDVKKFIFNYDGKLLWVLKKSYNRLGDIHQQTKQNKIAVYFWEKSLYSNEYKYSDRKRHNTMLKKKIMQLKNELKTKNPNN